MLFCSDCDRNLLNTSISIGYAFNLDANVSKCCCASIVVGTNMATCFPSITVLKAARNAISVFP